MDDWQQYVLLEILDCIDNDDRLLAITQELINMEKLDLIPDSVSSKLFNQITLIIFKRIRVK